jgi:hypothetical protein
MSRYYRDLHDRELLSQAESILAELTRRHMLDVRVPCGAEPDQAYLVGCEVNSTSRSDNRLSLIVDRCFERPLPVWPEKDLETPSQPESD